MAVRKLKGTWWIDFQFKGIRHRIRSPENSLAGAQAYEGSLRHKLATGATIDGTQVRDEPTFEQFAAMWIKEYVAPNLKPSQQRNVGYVVNGALIPHFGKLALSNISTRSIEQYKAKKRTGGLANKTIKNHLSVLNRCLGSAYDWLALQGSPPKIKWPKCEPSEMDFLSFDECELLLAHATGLDYEMILTAVRTGMRQGELKGLQWPSVDWENRNLAVRYSRDDNAKTLVPPKSNRVRHIPIDVDVYELLFRRRKCAGYVFTDHNDEPFTHRLITSRLRQVCLNAGLRKIGWHTLRHTFASHLVMSGIPITVVKELMGHASVTTTMRYSHLAPSMLRSAIDVLNPKVAALADGSFGQPGVNRWLRSQHERFPEKDWGSASSLILSQEIGS